MALVNPNIAMSFKPTTEYQPRNVLAEYAQLQQIQGGQRQAEMADMQMQEYRQNKEALGRIQAAIVAKGGPPDLRAAANEMIKNPQYMDKGIQILETLKNQEAMDAYFNPPAAPVNAMAPAAAPAAPVNQLGADRSSIETKIAQLGRINDPRAIAEVKRLERQLTAIEPRVVGGSIYYPSNDEFKTPPKERTSTLMSPEEEAQKLRIARAGRSITGGGGSGSGGGGGEIDKVVTDESGKTRFFTKTGQEITPTSATGESTAIQGKPSATFEKTRAQKQQLTKNIDSTINELSEITKKGGLIDQSTGSGVGRLVDVGARFVGQALPGDIAIGKLQPIADMALKMVPRFEGPQSDKDTATYKQAAGQLADPTLPTAIRKAAGIEVLRLLKLRKNQFVTQEMADQGIAPSTSGTSTPAKPVNLPSGWSVEVN
jgi:hypothetical protein